MSCQILNVCVSSVHPPEAVPITTVTVPAVSPPGPGHTFGLQGERTVHQYRHNDPPNENTGNDFLNDPECPLRAEAAVRPPRGQRDQLQASCHSKKGNKIHDEASCMFVLSPIPIRAYMAFPGVAAL